MLSQIRREPGIKQQRKSHFLQYDTDVDAIHTSYAERTLTFPLAPTGTYDFQVDWLPSATLTFPLSPTGTYDFQVDWGDGSSSYCNTWNNCSHQYSQNSLYNVSIVGLLNGFSFINKFSTMASKLVDVGRRLSWEWWVPVRWSNNLMLPNA
eukprot:g70626.t1